MALGGVPFSDEVKKTLLLELYSFPYQIAHSGAGKILQTDPVGSGWCPFGEQSDSNTVTEILM